MVIKPIRTEADHDTALAQAERLMERNPRPGTSEGDRLEILLTLIDAWEDRQHPIEEADPVDVIRFAMQAAGRTQADLAVLIGSRARASEILQRKRRLTLAMIWKLSERWKIPADALVRPYELQTHS